MPTDATAMFEDIVQARIAALEWAVSAPMAILRDVLEAGRASLDRRGELRLPAVEAAIPADCSDEAADAFRDVVRSVATFRLRVLTWTPEQKTRAIVLLLAEGDRVGVALANELMAS